MPSGVLGYKRAMCAYGCRQDSDCTEKPDGKCNLAPTTTCCPLEHPRCTYPGDGPVGDECPPSRPADPLPRAARNSPA